MFKHPTGNTPKKVILLGLGPSKTDFANIMASTGGDTIDHDEVWGVNTAGACFNVDMSFAMDDYLYCQNTLPNMAKFYETNDKPIITTVPRKGCPSAIEYPLGEVLNIPGARDWFNHTIPYIVAYAALIGVEELIIFGTDYIAQEAQYGKPAEQSNLIARYMSCTTFWLGLCAGRGMNIVVTPSSPLLAADKHDIDKLYGYIVPPVIRREDEPPKPTSG